MDSTWETSGGAATKNKWEGEDEEDEVADSWDQEDASEPVSSEFLASATIQPSGGDRKKKCKERDREAEEFDQPDIELTPEEKLAEKLRRQKLQEESDLNLAKEIFGVSSNGSLETKQDFDHFRDEILKQVNVCSKNADYVNFAEELVQALCLHLSSIDIKKIHNNVGNLHIEKLKLEKGDKGKKHKGKIKAKLKMDDETDYNEFSAYTTDDFNDFM